SWGAFRELDFFTSVWINGSGQEYKPLEVEGLYLEFCALAEADENTIRYFHQKWGPLGLIAWQYQQTVTVGEQLYYVPYETGPLVPYKPEENQPPVEILLNWPYFNLDLREQPDEVRRQAQIMTSIIDLIQSLKDTGSKFRRGIDVETDWHGLRKAFAAYVSLIYQRGYNEALQEAATLDEGTLMLRCQNFVTDALNAALLRISQRLDNASLVARFSSLLAAMYFQLIIDLTAGRPPRRCAHCSTFFQPSSHNPIYCSPQCQTNAKQARYRMRRAGGLKRPVGRPKKGKEESRSGAEYAC
ncbi:MAG: hypothetical protein PWQ98_957, partial [Moorella sp. (in: firmicutes)]|nr:hypothetical protein [Moorella sp. (in: firmicutes)]